IDIMSGQHMQPSRQRPDTEPITSLQHDGVVTTHTKQIAAGITITIQLPSRPFRGSGCARAAEQIPRQEPSAACLSRNLRLRPVRDCYEQAVFVETQPGSAGSRINASQCMTRSLQNTRR